MNICIPVFRLKNLQEGVQNNTPHTSNAVLIFFFKDDKCP